MALFSENDIHEIDVALARIEGILAGKWPCFARRITLGNERHIQFRLIRLEMFLLTHECWVNSEISQLKKAQ